MCEGRQHPRRGILTNALAPGLPLTERVRAVAANLARRLRGGRLHDCCGRYGEPGC